MIFRHALSEFLAGLRHEESQPVLDLEPVSGFLVHRAGKFVATIHWNEVREIVAFRYQGQRSDMMALVFRLKDDTEIETKEDSPRWVELVDAILNSFPSIPRDWYLHVATAAPADGQPQQRTILFKCA